MASACGTFRMFLLAQDELDGRRSAGDYGFEMNLPLYIGMVWATLCADVITDMEIRNAAI